MRLPTSLPDLRVPAFPRSVVSRVIDKVTELTGRLTSHLIGALVSQSLSGRASVAVRIRASTALLEHRFSGMLLALTFDVPLR